MAFATASDVDLNVHERSAEVVSEATQPDHPRRRLVVVGPLPPPVHGVAISTALALENADLQRKFDVEHLDTTDRRSIENLGRWDVENIRLAIAALARFVVKIRGSRRGTVYLPLSENRGGFLRDSLLIHVARARGWTAAVHIRNCLFRDFYSGQPRVFRWWIQFTMRRITGVAVLGETLRFLMEGFVDERRVGVVPNGTPDFVRPDVEPDRSLVLYLSNISRKKGAKQAVATAALVADQMPGVRFVFAGGWESSAFELEIRRLTAPLGERVSFPGLVDGDEKARLLAQARVLLFPVAYGEGHPRILLESMAAGLPIVTTDRATIRESIVDGESGFIVDDPVPSDLASRVLALLEDDELHARMGKAARARYLERFTQDVTDRRLAAWIESVAKLRL